MNSRTSLNVSFSGQQVNVLGSTEGSVMGPASTSAVTSFYTPISAE